MLDPHRPIAVAGLSGVRVYTDTRDASTFYALPASPVVEDLELTLTGQRQAAGFQVSGGVVSLTTTLSLEAALRRRVEKRLMQQAGGRPVRLAPATWSAGAVEVRLIPRVTLAGRPALYGDNRCALQAKLDAASARELEQAWEGGLRDAQVEYRLTSGATPGTTRRSLRFESSRRTSDGREQRTVTEKTSSSRRSAGSAAELRFAGPLRGGRLGSVRRIGM
ncbi:MAG: hypothetical protein AAF604_22900 [Acidobacteriota bacterium]